MLAPVDMKNAPSAPGNPHHSKSKLLSAALHLFRSKGYSATTVEEICNRAGVTKGSFFHHFKSKDDLALGAVAHWRTMTEGLFKSAPYHRADDPLDRVLQYVAFRASILKGELSEYTCLLGTLVQETYESHPEIRAVCDAALSAHIAELTRDLKAAKRAYAANAKWTPESVGTFMQTVLQGSFIFAKARQSPEVALATLTHLRRYLVLLFTQPSQTRNEKVRRRPTHNRDAGASLSPA
jgi:TetR/AcrR family transcriptional repressor of nem operon